MNVILFSEVTAERVIGGAERVLRQQSLGLAKLGHHVRVIVRAPCESAEATCSIGNVTERRYPVTRTSEPAFVWSSVQNALRAFDVVRQTGPVDVGVIHQSLAGLGPILSRYRAVGRWVYVCHSLAHEEYLTRAERASSAVERVRRKLSARARRWIERMVMRRCHHVVVLSEFMKRQVMAAHGIGSKNITVVPGAADLAMFYPAEDRAEVRRELKIPESRRVLFTVRNLVPRMGLEHLIEAITLLGEERRNLLLLIGGEGPLRQRLEELIRSKGLQDSVQLLGFVPEEQLAKYYQASDLVVMPTLQLEGFGLVTVEALACGTPVMGTPVGAIPEVLRTVDPLLVTEGTDGGSLAKTLRLWLTRFREQPGARERLSRKGREAVERRFNWEAHTAQLDRLFAAGSKDGQMIGARKVIHVITRLDYGGSAQNTMLTALGHDPAQFEPLVVAGYPGSWDAQGGQAATEENCRRLDRAGVRWLLLPSLTRAVHPLKDLQTLWQLIGLFRREQPALVHTHTSKAGVLGRMAAWSARVPVIVHTPHGHVFYGHFGPFRSWLFLQIERGLSAITDRLIALTDAERQDHLDRAVGRADRFAVVPSGIDREKFGQARAQGKQQPDWFGCPADALVVGSVGWLTDIKGHEYLIEAIALLKQDVPSLHLVIVGSGDRQDALRQRAASLGLRDAVHLLGHRDDVDICLAGMDLFVLPSLNEGMGRALIEAMAAGLPVIASRVGGIPSVIDHERTGLLVSPGDPGALAAALRRLLDQPEWARQLGAAASRSVDSRYGSLSMVHAIESIFAEALTIHGKRERRMRWGGRLILPLMALAVVLCGMVGHVDASDDRPQLLATFHVHSTASTGDMTVEALAARAEQLGLDVLILTDNFSLRYEYGLWPLRGILKQRVSVSSVLDYGIERYLDEIAAAQRRHPRLIIVPGVEVAPYYYWTGSLAAGILTMHNAQRNLLVLGLTKPEDYRSLPASGNPGSYIVDWQVVVNGAPILLVVPAVWLWRPFRSAADRRSPGRMVSVVLIVLAVALVANAWPLSQPAFSSYDAGLGYRPYQALIDDVRNKGGLSFWSMTEARDFHEYGFGPLGTVTVKTEAHPESLLQTTGYTGFGGLYQDGRTIIKPGELWDRLLQLPIDEQQPVPVLIGELAFHGLKDAGKDLNRVVTVLLVKERTMPAVLEALRAGRAYAVGEGDHHVQLRLDEFRVLCQGGTRSASMGDRLDLGGARDLMVRLSISAADHGRHPVKVRLIRSGQVVAQLAGETPYFVDWPDSTMPTVEQTTYRVEITGSGELLSNPIFVGPIHDPNAVSSQPSAFSSDMISFPKLKPKG